MNCGQEIHLKDIYLSVPVRFIAQCEGRFIQISNVPHIPNGYFVPDWHYVLRQLVALTVPAKLIEKTWSAESTASGHYVHVPLSYPLSVKGLAELLDAPADEVRALLDDLAVAVD